MKKIILLSALLFKVFLVSCSKNISAISNHPMQNYEEPSFHIDTEHDDCPNKQLLYISENMGAEVFLEGPEEFFKKMFNMGQDFFKKMPKCTERK